jgi:hypothetical protein
MEVDTRNVKNWQSFVGWLTVPAYSCEIVPLFKAGPIRALDLAIRGKEFRMNQLNAGLNVGMPKET